MGTRPSRRRVQPSPSPRPARTGRPDSNAAGTSGSANAKGHRALRVDIVAPPGVRAAGLGRWLGSVAPARARGDVTVALVPDSRVRALNRQYRDNDRPTDVLSFPADEPGLLGDVVIALGVAARQAKAAGHSLATELRVLALHGLLHLLGYDHEDDDGRMARAEARLRRKGGLREGLIERSR
jgi:probable rRNA maturation factor